MMLMVRQHLLLINIHTCIFMCIRTALSHQATIVAIIAATVAWTKWCSKQLCNNCNKDHIMYSPR